MESCCDCDACACVAGVRFIFLLIRRWRGHSIASATTLHFAPPSSGGDSGAAAGAAPAPVATPEKWKRGQAIAGAVTRLSNVLRDVGGALQTACAEQKELDARLESISGCPLRVRRPRGIGAKTCDANASLARRAEVVGQVC